MKIVSIEFHPKKILSGFRYACASCMPLKIGGILCYSLL